MESVIMKKIKLLVVLGVLALAPVTQAMANGYLMAGAGPSHDDILDESATGFKFGVGSTFGENIAGEVAFVDLGTIDIPIIGTEFSQYGLAASLSPVFKMSDQASAYAKLGLFSWTFEATGPFISGEDTGIDLFYGLGFEFKATDKLSIFAEYEMYEVADGDVSLVSVGLRIGL